jgi:methionyl-tRNA formyltransferase
MRALLIGAVEGTRVAMEAIAAAEGWTLAGLLTLPPTLARRHSDYRDLAADAAQVGAEVIFSASGNDDDTVAQVAAMAPDIAFVVGWSSLCGPRLIEAAGGRMVGYHPAALPRLRGRAAIPWTILLDEKITASTLFWVGKGVDDGPILAQRFFHVAPNETATTLYAKHMRALRSALDELLPRLARDIGTAGEPQDHGLATWAARRREQDGLVDWTWPVTEVDRLIRAATRPYPGALTFSGGNRISLWSAKIVGDPARFHGLPGQVVTLDEDGFRVMCGDGGVIQVTDYEIAGAASLSQHALLGQRA